MYQEETKTFTEFLLDNKYSKVPLLRQLTSKNQSCYYDNSLVKTSLLLRPPIFGPKQFIDLGFAIQTDLLFRPVILGPLSGLIKGTSLY